MEKISRALSTKFLSELNNKNILTEVKYFFDYAKSLYEDLLIVEKYYLDEFNTVSPLKINRYKIIFDNLFNSILQTIFGAEIKNQIYNKKSLNMLKYGRFDIDKLIKDNKKFALKFFTDDDFKTINNMANKLFKLELKCSKYTRKLWHFENKNNIKDGMFVKIITQENWRDKKLTPSLKKYYNSRIGLSVSFVNDKKSKFFKDNQLDILAGIVYATDSIICGNYFDSYTAEFINNKNPINNLSFTFTKINKIYKDKVNHKKHEIFAFGTLTATPLSVLSCDDIHNEVLIDKRNTKPLAVFYLNEQSLDYANELSKKHKLPVIKLESLNKLNVHNIVGSKNILDEKIHL